MTKAIVLLSGGLDSAVAAACAAQRYDEIVTLNFYYGQRHKKEIQHARKLAEHFKWPYEVCAVNFPGGSALIGNEGDISKELRGLPASFVPGRNLVFLSLAAGLAYTVGATVIVGGWNVVDYSGYPDCRQEFLDAAQEAINLALGFGVHNLHYVIIYAPIVSYTKTNVILLGNELNVPFELTWSCYEGRLRPCGICPSCVIRAKGFEDAGMKDPAL